MKEKRPARKNAYRTLCAAAGGAAVLAVWLRLGGWWADWTARSAVSAVCDACFLAGVVCCLLFVAELCRVMGAFDLMRYGFGSLLGIFRRGGAERERKYADFASYLASGKRGARSRKTALYFAAGWFALGAAGAAGTFSSSARTAKRDVWRRSAARRRGAPAPAISASARTGSVCSSAAGIPAPRSASPSAKTGFSPPRRAGGKPRRGVCSVLRDMMVRSRPVLRAGSF